MVECSFLHRPRESVVCSALQCMLTCVMYDAIVHSRAMAALTVDMMCEELFKDGGGSGTSMPRVRLRVHRYNSRL